VFDFETRESIQVKSSQVESRERPPVSANCLGFGSTQIGWSGMRECQIRF
jgi:hypothetical protein